MEPARGTKGGTTTALQHPRASAAHDGPVVIVGAGPAGVRAAQELLQQAPRQPLQLFGEEPGEPYNRVHLSAVLAGQASMDDLWLELGEDAGASVDCHPGRRVVAIDRKRRRVHDDRGNSHPFSRLILATGSRPAVPPLPGMDLPGVHTFRNRFDVEALARLRDDARHVVVLGGGLLGLEAARGLTGDTTAVTVVEAAGWPMARQLESDAGAVLRRALTSAGLEIEVDTRVQALVGDDRVTAVRLEDGRELTCDAVVVATGVAPNTELAEECGLNVERGIWVDDQMRTSDPEIHAVGECAEHNGHIYGLAGPALEQARVAAASVLGNPVHYRGSHEVTRLKLVAQPVFSAGRVDEEARHPEDRVITHARPRRGIHRRIVVNRGRLVGAQAVGDWPDSGWAGDAIIRGTPLGPWQRLRFRWTGRLAPTARGGVASWPEAATVCDCASVSRGRLSAALATGADDVEALSRATGAGTVCGSCRPLLGELAGRPTGVLLTRALGALSLAALAAALLVTVLPSVPVPSSVQSASALQVLWQDDLYRQISGFSLLALVIAGLLLSARKRIARVRWGQATSWRLVHVGVGAACAAGLAVHTGLALGDNLNRLLVANFLVVACLGAATGLVYAHGRRPDAPARRWLWWGHLLATWPLPVLLGYHIVASYYF